MALPDVAYEYYRPVIRALKNDGFDEDAAEVYFNHVAVHLTDFDTEKVVEIANSWYEAVSLRGLRNQIRRAYPGIASADNLLPVYKELIPAKSPAKVASFAVTGDDTSVTVNYSDENGKSIKSITHKL